VAAIICYREVEDSPASGALELVHRACEHVGSTSVPGMCAKPCIDLALGIDTTKGTDEARRLISRLAYEHFTGEESWIVLGRDTRAISYRVHVVPYNGVAWRQLISLRDYLRTHVNIATEYCELKQKLAAEYRWNRAGYSQAKSAFVRAVTSLALMNSRHEDHKAEPPDPVALGQAGAE
jgi:GrpB-like predicted nucleotidyltransferase (UPF0157 family)